MIGEALVSDPIVLAKCGHNKIDFSSHNLMLLHKIPRKQARMILKQCPDCLIHSQVPCLGANSQGLIPNRIWQIDSTHYSELLDEFERNDSIYITKNKDGITAEKLSGILKRNDIKKSEIYDSDFLEGTVPAYESYIALKKALISLR